MAGELEQQPVDEPGVVQQPTAEEIEAAARFIREMRLLGAVKVAVGAVFVDFAPAAGRAC